MAHRAPPSLLLPTAGRDIYKREPRFIESLPPEAKDWIRNSEIATFVFAVGAMVFIFTCLAWPYTPREYGHDAIFEAEYWRELFSSWLGGLAVSFFGLAIGAIGFWIREQRRSPIYAAIELCVGMAVAGLALRPGTTLVVSVVAFLGGVRVIIDGLKRMKEFRLAGRMD